MMEGMEKTERTKEFLAQAAAFVGEAALETLWPTRCAVCDAPGELLCDKCRANLPYIDWWRACPKCGAPFGRVQCSECNPVMLRASGRTSFPFEGAASALVYDTAARRIVSAYKDKGERRLAHAMAEIMVPYAAPAWCDAAEAVTFVPSSAAAHRSRGFDHAELLAREVACALNLPCTSVFQRPKSRDQRKLSRSKRLANLEGRISVLPGATPPKSVIVVDDVCTTGATLSGAACALRTANADHVWCLTFARTW